MGQETVEIKEIDVHTKATKEALDALDYSYSSKPKRRNYKKWFFVLLALGVLLGGLIATIVYDATTALPPDQQWWHKNIIYQIYPRSFKDSNGDGVGDLKGITEKMEYLKDLRVETVWLSPIYKSPMRDFGYDVQDYKDIHSEFGTMEDFKEMIKKAHDQGIKIVMDFVPNHTSNESEWFVNSEKCAWPCADNKFRDYYVWHNGTGNETHPMPPNDWVSVFGGSAWNYSQTRKQWYLHQFLDSMPDLNWRSEAVRNDMDSVLTFWLDQGVDGFRIDALPHLFEVPENETTTCMEDQIVPGRENMSDMSYPKWIHRCTRDRQETIEMSYRWKDLLAKYAKDNKQEDKFIILEILDSNVTEVYRYFPNSDPFTTPMMPFYFGLILNLNENSTGIDIKNTVRAYTKDLPERASPSWVIGSHDQKRAAQRLGNKELIDGLNMINLLLPGIPTAYYGDEIGMENAKITRETMRDPQAWIAYYANESNYLELSRDYGRSPMQWSDDANAGFSTNATTWLPLAPYWNETKNVKYQQSQEHSHLKVFKSLTKLRRREVFRKGDMQILLANTDIFSFSRHLSGKQYLVAVDMRRNRTLEEVKYNFREGKAKLYTASVNVYSRNSSLANLAADRMVDLSAVPLGPSQSVVLEFM